MVSLQNFFYWGQVPLTDEIQDDILVGMVQGKRTLFYDRSYGGGIPDYENAPMNLATFIAIRYEAAKLFATRNLVVTSGNGGYPDRRALTSQAQVQIQQDSESGLTVTIGYILMSDITRKQSVSLPIGGVR
jgi:hypothetical protein